MSEDRNRGSRDFSRYDSMTTEDLEEILRLDADALMEQESDTELILYVMEVLAKRQNKTNTGKTAEESWESFQKHYLTQDAEHRGHTQKAATHGKTPQPWLRRLIACAAAIILVLCIPITTKAFGWEDVLNLIARLGKETFAFFSGENADNSEPSPKYDGEYSSLQDVLRANKRDDSMVPTWIPSGYTLDKIDKDISPIKEVYVAYYVNGSNELMLRLQTFVSTDLQNIEIEKDNVEVYNALGIDYYIFSNMDQLQIIWCKNSYECIISGNISITEAKKMIDSIAKG